MKIVCKFSGIDCPVCALKLEQKIKKLEGVISCSINFLAERIDLEIENKEIFQKIVEICNDFEDGVTLKRIK